MVNTAVKSKFFHHICAFFSTSSDTDDSTTIYLCNLSNSRPDSTRCRGNDERISRYRLAYIEEAGVGGDTWHTQHAERRGNWRI